MLSKFVLTLRFALVCTLSLVATATLAQTTIHVGSGQAYTTIQSGIDAANNGDTVLVDPGTYHENINFNGKAITVTSSGGAASTIIDGGSAGPAVTFKSGETSASTISGFTIQHGGVVGNYTGTGSLYLFDTTPTIANNIITLSNCWAIESNYSAPVIQNNTISATQDPGTCGVPGGSAILISSWLGGVPGSPNPYSGYILGNIIENNVESGLEDGGGEGGAGIYVWDGAPIIESNIIRNNTTVGGSGGAIIIFSTPRQVIVAQNLIYGNSAGCGGGAIATSGHGLFAINNTMVDNVFDSSGGGYSECAPIAQIYPSPDLYGQDNPSDVFINNIISGSSSYPAVDCSWFSAPNEANQPTFQNNILYNAGGPFFGSHCVDVSGKYNNIAADPQFVSPSTHDYHLKSTSPAIDSGQNNVQRTFKTTTGLDFTRDFDGHPRVQDATGKGCIIDMGAYEYPGASSNCGTLETLTSSLNPALFGQSVTFTAQLTMEPGIPTGSIQFLDGTTPLSTQAVSSTGSSSFSTSSLAVGSHNITANYEPSGSFSASTASLTQVINGYATTTTLSCLPNPIGVGETSAFAATVTSANGTPTGSVAFTDNGATLATQGLLSGTTSFTYTGSVAGTHTIVATYIPAGPFAASSATCSEVANAIPTTSVLAVTPAVSTYGSPVALSATVSPATLPGPSTPTGVVTFYNGASAIGTATLVDGIANLTLASLPTGSYNLTCMYSGSSIYSVSNCNPVPVVIQAPPVTGDFEINVKPGSVSVYPGNTAKVKVYVTSLRGFSEQLALSCAGLPEESSCQFSPVSLTNGQGEAALVIQTTPPHRRQTSAAAGIARIPGVLAFVIMLGWRRRRGLLAKMLTVFLAANILFAAAGMLAGCGAPPGATGGTPPGVYQVAVTATATGSGAALTHSAPVTLTVKSY